MHFEVLRIMLKKVISEHLSRVKNSEDSLKPICMLKNASLKVLGFGKVQDNKALHKRYINVKSSLNDTNRQQEIKA